MNHKQIILVILDGWGYRPEKEHNAIAEARTPFFDYLWEKFPHSLLDASGEAVGLPEGQIGSSEVGHMTIGAGTALDNDLVRITKAIERKEFSDNKILKNAFSHVKKHNSSLHLQGLIGPGGIHSHQEHLHEILREAKKAGIEKVVIHAFTDGRDLPPQSAHLYLKELENLIKDLGIGYIATATGRYYAMDRDNNWDRIERAELALFENKGKEHKSEKPSEVLKELYKEGILDEYLEPVVFLDDTGKSYSISRNDAVIFFNFRPDRARQLIKKISERRQTLNLYIAGMTEYDNNLGLPAIFAPKIIETTLAEQVSLAGLTQAHVAETDKYAHITYFLNGGREEVHKGEERKMVESRKDVYKHDEAPEMMAKEITDSVIDYISQGINFIAVNFANADIIGHTGNKPAVIKAIETIDAELKRLVEAADKHHALVLVTADHGNAELNVDPKTGVMHTAHTGNLVPAIITDNQYKMKERGTLADVADTVLELMGLPKPVSMTGESLLQNR